MSKKENLRKFENVKIYGFDPNSEPDQFGRYSAALYISQEQKEFIDSFVFGKCEVTKDNEIIYQARSKKPILFYDKDKNKITEAYTEGAFIADVSLLFDSFAKDDGEIINYIKPIMIRFVSKIENTKVRIFVKEEFSYEDCFESDGENKGLITKEEMNAASEPPATDPITENFGEAPSIDDSPF